MQELFESKTQIVHQQVEDTCFAPIDPKLAERFNITENIWAHQYATENGIYITFTNSKNKVIGNHHEANNQDYGE